jgi:hypothetical protein
VKEWEVRCGRMGEWNGSRKFIVVIVVIMERESE